MRYYKLIEDKKLIAIGTGYGGTEITEAEYNALLTMIREKAALVDKLYIGEITIEDVPTEWQDEIQRRVDERIAQQGTIEDRELSAEEALDIILGGETA
jgi:hypothetical protein